MRGYLTFNLLLLYIQLFSSFSYKSHTEGNNQPVMIVYPFQTKYVSVTAFHITVLNYLCQLIHKLFAISFIDVASFVTTVLVASGFYMHFRGYSCTSLQFTSNIICFFRFLYNLLQNLKKQNRGAVEN